MSAPYSLADVRTVHSARGAWWTVVLVDPVADRLVVPIANRTSLTPNQLTILAAALGGGAAAAFFDGSRTALVAGAVLFHLSFVVDSMDGKLARLKGAGTLFGAWLDYMLDRLKAAACAAALMTGQYLQTDRIVFLYLGMLVLFGEFFRQLHAATVRNLNPLAPDVAGTGPRDVGPPGRLRAWLLRHRIRPYLWSGIEFEMFVFIIGPLTGAIVEVTVVSLGLLFVFEAAFSYRVWHATQDADRRDALQRTLAGRPA